MANATPRDDDGAPPALPPSPDVLLSMLADAANGERILGDVRDLVARDRWNSFDRFAQTTALLCRRFRDAGADTETFRIQTGGHPAAGRWIVPEAMDIAAASIDLVRPHAAHITDYAGNPWCVIHWAAGTPADGLTCPVRIVDRKEDLERLGADALAGQAVLTKLRPTGLHRHVAALGAAALVCDSPVAKLPDATLWGKFGWGGLAWGTGNTRLPGFMLSATQGAELREMIQDGREVVLRLTLDARHGVGHHDVVSGLVQGRADPQDEVWAVAHSSEPGAVDNASGVAVCLESVRLLEALIDSGQLRRPKRTIRALAGMECYGFFEYLIRKRRLQPPLAGLVVDCVGAKSSVCKGVVTWHDTVPSSAGFVNDLGLTLFAQAHDLVGSDCSVAHAPFSSTEDTMLGDPRYGFPCPYVGSYPYKGYHCSADTPELLDPINLAACAAGTAAYLYALADGGTALAHAWQTACASGLASAGRDAAPEQQALRGVQWHVTGTRLRRWLWEQPADRSPVPKAAVLTSWARQLPPDTAGDTRVPFRTMPLAPTYENVPEEIGREVRQSGVHKWALYWADGVRTLEQIRVLAGAETGRDIATQNLSAFFEAMHRLGYVRLVPLAETLRADQLVRDLRQLGLAPGMDLIVHSSLSAIGWVRGGADTVVDALLTAVGDTGTLLMPSFHHRQAQVYNPLTTPTTNGAIPDAFWRRPDVIRTNQATHAIAARGPKTADWLDGHAEKGIWAQNSPIGRLVHEGGHILGLGVDHTASTAYHVAEVSLQAPCLDPFGSTDRVVNPEGQVVTQPGLSWRDGQCPVSPKRLSEALDDRDLQRRGRVGRANCVLCRAIDLWHVRREHLRDACPTCRIRPKHLH